MSDTTAAKMYRESARGHADTAARKAAEADKLLAQAGSYGKLAVEHERKAQAAEAAPKPETVSVTLGGYHDPNLPLGEKPSIVEPVMAAVRAAARTPIQWPKPVTPADAKTISTADLAKVIKASKFNRFQHIYTDSKYVGLTRDEWNAVLEEAHTKAVKYVATVEDCDDHGALARGVVPAISHANGISWVLDFSGKHSYNLVLVVEADGSFGVEAVEPQLDKLVPFTRVGSDPYAAREGIAIW